MWNAVLLTSCKWPRPVLQYIMNLLVLNKKCPATPPSPPSRTLRGSLPKILVEDGIAFVNRSAAATAIAPSGDVADPPSTPAPPTLPAEDVVASVSTTCTTPAAGYVSSNSTNADAVLPPPPQVEVTATSEAVGWGEAFGPPYSAIFLDVDSKDTSVGMSCPPAAFLESAFLANLNALLRGAKTTDGGGGAPGVLAVNVAARSNELYVNAVDSIREAFVDGEVGKRAWWSPVVCDDCD